MKFTFYMVLFSCGFWCSVHGAVGDNVGMWITGAVLIGAWVVWVYERGGE